MIASPLEAARQNNRVFDSITQTVFNTPLVRLRKVIPEQHATVLLKTESFNHMSSVKDRITEEGILAGISTGANLAAAANLAALPENHRKIIVTIWVNFGERYLIYRPFQTIYHMRFSDHPIRLCSRSIVK